MPPDQPSQERKITGIMIEGAFQRENDQMLLYLRITNKSPNIITVEMINKKLFITMPNFYFAGFRSAVQRKFIPAAAKQH